MQLYSEKQYKKYCKFCSKIANGDMLDGFFVYQNLKKWIVKEKISDLALSNMDKRMEKECEEEMKSKSISRLHIVK
jgi:hypothetical protein